MNSKMNIPYDIVVANAIYHIGKCIVTDNEINLYLSICDKFFLKNKIEMTGRNTLDKFCEKYYYLVDKRDDIIYVTVDLDKYKSHMLFGLSQPVYSIFFEINKLYDKISPKEKKGIRR